jgi:hypothetical protein
VRASYTAHIIATSRADCSSSCVPRTCL